MESASVSKKSNRRTSKKNDQNGGWTLVTGKPRYKRVTVTLPKELLEDLTPLEAAVYNVIQRRKHPVTAGIITEIILKEMNCTKSDVGNVLYGRLKPYVEAENWKERPRKWKMCTQKVKVK